jgi:catenin alpha
MIFLLYQVIISARALFINMDRAKIVIFFIENHILEDVNKCVLALQEGDPDSLDRTAGAIRGRASRVANVVTAEMSNYEPGLYTERVLEAVKVLRDQVMPNFAGRVEIAVDALSTAPPKEVDENEFIDASRLVYDGVREIRRAVLMNRVSTLFIVINNTRVAFNFKNPG